MTRRRLPIGVRQCERAGCTVELPARARSDRRFCGTACQVATYRATHTPRTEVEGEAPGVAS